MFPWKAAVKVSRFSGQVSSQPAGRRDGALIRPEARNWPAEEEANRAGREADGQNPGAGKVIGPNIS